MSSRSLETGTLLYALCALRLPNPAHLSSLERVQQYVTIEQEKPPTNTGVPPAYWPASGSLRVEKLSARYSADGPRVLHEISFEVKAGERVCIGESSCLWFECTLV